MLGARQRCSRKSNAAWAIVQGIETTEWVSRDVECLNDEATLVVFAWSFPSPECRQRRLDLRKVRQDFACSSPSFVLPQHRVPASIMPNPLGCRHEYLSVVRIDRRRQALRRAAATIV